MTYVKQSANERSGTGGSIQQYGMAVLFQNLFCRMNYLLSASDFLQ